jgi:hypothetical protein
MSLNIASLNKKYLYEPYEVLKKLHANLSHIFTSIRHDINDNGKVKTETATHIKNWFCYLKTLLDKKIGYLSYGTTKYIICVQMAEESACNSYKLIDLCKISLLQLNANLVDVQKCGKIISGNEILVNIKLVLKSIYMCMEKICSTIFTESDVSNCSVMSQSDNNMIVVKSNFKKHKKHHNKSSSSSSSHDDTCEDSYNDCNTSTSEQNHCNPKPDTSTCIEESTTEQNCEPCEKPQCETNERGNKIITINYLYSGKCIKNVACASGGSFMGEFLLDLSNGCIYQWSGSNWVCVNINICFPFYYLCCNGTIYYVYKKHCNICVDDIVKYYNLSPGDILIVTNDSLLYKLNGCCKWTLECNLSGPTGQTGATGQVGTVIDCVCIGITGRMGLQEPSVLGPLSGVEGDLYLQFGLSCDLYKYSGGNWIDASNLSGLFDYYGNPITQPFLFYGLDVNSGQYLIVNVINLGNDTCELFTMRIGDKILDCCSGNLYMYDGVQWLTNCNLKGPTGQTPTALMFFSTPGTITNGGAYIGQNSVAPTTNFELVSVVIPGFTALEFTVRLNTGTVPIGETITYGLYNQTSSTPGTETLLTSLVLNQTEFTKTNIINIPISALSTLAVRVTPTVSITGTSASLRFSA